MSEKYKNKIIWFFSFVVIGVGFLKILGDFTGKNLDQSNWFLGLFLISSVTLLLLHSFETLSPLRAAFFIFLASGTGLLAEVLGLKYGVLFGGYYFYRAGQLSILGVPLAAVLYWSIFVYTGYCIVNSFLVWLGKEKPAAKNNNFLLLPLLVFIDAWIVLAIDLFMDPLQVKAGNWLWLDGGTYFNVPIGNFIGWFIVVAIITGIFRLYEYFFPQNFEKQKRSILIIPVLNYAILALSFTIVAQGYGLIFLTFIGLAVMLSAVAVNIVLFSRYLKREGFNDINDFFNL